VINDSKIVVALDFPTEAAALELTAKLSPEECKLKVGKELFTRAGRGIVEKLVADGFDLFLDLKYHDIPNTVAHACAAAADLGVWMVNVHASGGRKMMEAAAEIFAKRGESPLLIAVTVLTSMDQSDLIEIGLEVDPAQQVSRLATLAQSSGMDGVVCSPLEIELLRNELNRDFKLITPGIRPAGSATGDQKRVMTPADAVKMGSDWLVIGRPITQAPDPVAALHSINSSLKN